MTQFALATKTVTLPSYPWSEVVVKKISVWKQREIQKKYNISSTTAQDEQTSIDASFDMIVEWIVSRNFVIGEWENQQKVEVTAENVAQMPEEDISLLIFEILAIETPKYRKNG